MQVVYYNCVKFHKNSISSLVGIVLTRYMSPTPFHESISWIISPFEFWTATIFLHAHLQVVYYKCVKFHKNPISGLEGVALTRYMDGRTDGVIPIYPQTLFVGDMGIQTIDIKLFRLYTVKTVQTNILSISMHFYKCICICKTWNGMI